MRPQEGGSVDRGMADAGRLHRALQPVPQGHRQLKRAPPDPHRQSPDGDVGNGQLACALGLLEYAGRRCREPAEFGQQQPQPHVRVEQEDRRLWPVGGGDLPRASGTTGSARGGRIGAAKSQPGSGASSGSTAVAVPTIQPNAEGSLSVMGTSFATGRQ